MFRETSYVEDLNAADPSPRRKGDLSALTFLKPYLKPYQKTAVWAMISVVAASLSVLSLGQGMASLVNNGLAQGHLLTSISFLFIMIVVMALASYGRFYCVSWVGENMIADIRRQALDHLLKLSPAFYETHGSGQILSWLMTDTTQLQVLAGNSIGVALRNVMMLLGGFIMMLVTSLKLTLVTLTIVPLVVLIMLVYAKSVRRLSTASQEALSGLSAALEEGISAFRTVLAFGREGWFYSKFSGLSAAHLRLTQKHLHARGLMTAFVIILVFSAICLVLWQGVSDVLSHKMTQGELTAFLFYAILVAGTGGSISEVMADLARAAGATERLRALFATTSTVITKAPLTPLPTVRGEIKCCDLTFFYPARPENPALIGVDFAIEPGERVAIVGPSGAGKSTIFQLLLRFYDPSSGCMMVDGADIGHLPPSLLRPCFGWVPQDAVIFSGTIFDNIALAVSGESTPREAVMAAATAAFAHDFIVDLPKGYDTFVGVKGVRLSGGQRQRLGLARVFLQNPPILLLDEPTSALDSLSEAAVQKALEVLMRNRTTMTIAHRLSTVMKADRLLVMDQGRIVAEGTHAHLLETSPLYQQLVEKQSLI